MAVRRLVRSFLLLLTVAVFAIVALLIVAETSWFKNWLRTQAVVRASSVLDGELRIDRLSGSLWSGVVLDGVAIVQAGRQVVTADRIRVNYDAWTLIRRHWIIDELTVERPVIDVVQTARGWNVAHLVKPRDTRSGATTEFAIRRLKLVAATVSVAPANGSARTLTNVNFDGSVHLDRGLWALDVFSFRGHDEPSGFDVRSLSARAAPGFQTFEARFEADSGAARIAGLVTGDRREAATFHTELDLTHVDLRPLIGRKNLPTDISGHLVANASPASSNNGWRATFEFAGAQTTALGYAADQLDAKGFVDGKAVTFDARAHAYGARATITAAWTFASAAFEGRGTFGALDLRRLPSALRVPRLATVLSGTYTIAKHATSWRATTRLASSTVEGATIERGTLGQVRASRGVTSYSASGSLRGLDLRRLSAPLELDALGDARLSSQLNGGFYVMGRETAGAPRWLVGGAALEDSRISGTTLSRMNAAIHLVGRRLAVDAHGEYAGLTDRAIGLAPTEPITLTGRIDGLFVVRDLDAPLTVDNFEADGRVELVSSTVQGVAIDSAVIDAMLDGDRVTIRDSAIHGEGVDIVASGTLGVNATDAPGLLVKADVADLQTIARHVDRPLAGAASIEATVRGSFRSPIAEGSLTTRSLAYGTVATALTTTNKYQVEWPDRDVERLTFTLDTTATFVEVSGRRITNLVSSVRGGLREVTVDVQADQNERSIGLEGVVALQPEAREIRLRRLALAAADLRWELPSGREATVRYGRDRIEVRDLTLARGDQLIDVAGSLDHAGAGAGSDREGGRLAVRLQNVQIADINQVLPSGRTLSGVLDGTVTVTGSRAAPVVDADLGVRNGNVQGATFSAAGARVSYAAGVASIDGTVEQAPGITLRAVGTVPVRADATAAIDLKVSGGPMNLGLVQAFTTEISNVTGTATLDVRIAGSRREPDFRGTLAIDAGAFEVNATGARYQDLNALVRLEGPRLAIERLAIADASGDRLTMEGGLDVLGEAVKRQIDVTVRAVSVTVLQNRFGTAEMDADLRVSGTLGALEVSGTATLDSGRLEVGDILEQTSKSPYSTTPQGPLSTAGAAPAAPSLWDRTNLDVRLRFPDNLALRGRGLRPSSGGFAIGDMNIVAGGSIEVKKAPGSAMSVLGALEVVRGTYSFQGRRFEVERGSDVRFRGGPMSDPSLNVTASREVSGVTAQVRVQGSARSPEITISSSPPLDQGDVMSLIVFNQPINALGEAERVNLGERAAAIAAGALTTPLADSIARALNLDLVEIQAPSSESGTGAIDIGSRVGSRVFVGLRQHFGRDDASLVTLEYRVSELLRFVTSIAQGALQAHATNRVEQSGVDLFFVVRY